MHNNGSTALYPIGLISYLGLVVGADKVLRNTGHADAANVAIVLGLVAAGFALKNGHDLLCVVPIVSTSSLFIGPLAVIVGAAAGSLASDAKSLR